MVPSPVSPKTNILGNTSALQQTGYWLWYSGDKEYFSPKILPASLFQPHPLPSRPCILKPRSAPISLTLSLQRCDTHGVIQCGAFWSWLLSLTVTLWRVFRLHLLCCCCSLLSPIFNASLQGSDKRIQCKFNAECCGVWPDCWVTLKRSLNPWVGLSWWHEWVILNDFPHWIFQMLWPAAKIINIANPLARIKWAS